MSESENGNKRVLTEAVMLARLNKADEIREFFIDIWKQNPALAKQGGVRVQNLLSTVESKQRGISLIELIIFIVIISVALTGILLVMNQVTRHSADPMIHKQALAIAESLLEEVELMPFTYCDPDDASAVAATSSSGCTGGAGGANDESKLPLAPETGETRYAVATPFDNVSDYNGFDSAADGGVKDITGTVIAGLGGYRAQITVAQAGLVLGLPLDENGLHIAVTVTGPDSVPIVLDGYRTRYAPGSGP